jgi:hypothetical protein
MALSIVQLVFPPLSNVAMSLAVGATVSFAPPLAVDQLVFAVKLPPAGPIQYLTAAEAESTEATKKRHPETKVRRRTFFNPLFILEATVFVTCLCTMIQHNCSTGR